MAKGDRKLGGNAFFSPDYAIPTLDSGVKIGEYRMRYCERRPGIRIQYTSNEDERFEEIIMYDIGRVYDE